MAVQDDASANLFVHPEGAFALWALGARNFSLLTFQASYAAVLVVGAPAAMDEEVLSFGAGVARARHTFAGDAADDAAAAAGAADAACVGHVAVRSAGGEDGGYASFELEGVRRSGGSEP